MTRPMEYFQLNGSKVSRIGLGTWAIGGREWGNVTEDNGVATCLSIFDYGINLIDTAPIYGHGRAEEIVGKALRHHGKREDFYIATKAGLEWNDKGVFANSDPERLRQELEESLRRLGVDYIDLYQVHWPDTALPIEAAAAELLKFYEEEKIRAIGVSNFSVEQMDAFRAIAPLHSNQPPYNLFERAIDADVLPYCERNSIAVLTYSSLCRSMLGGQLTINTEFVQGDIRGVDPKFQSPRFAQYLAAVAKLESYAKEHYDKRVLHLALRWVLDRPGVSAALWGAKRPDQLEAIDEVLGWNLDPEAMEAIDGIVAGTIHDPVGPEYLTPARRAI